jgi:hypothetical protein
MISTSVALSLNVPVLPLPFERRIISACPGLYIPRWYLYAGSSDNAGLALSRLE